MSQAAGSAAPTPWSDALLAAELFAVDPLGLGGVVVRASSGPARDAWLATLQAHLASGTGVRRIPLHCPVDRLLGGLDLAATLATGRRVVEPGVLAKSDGGVAVLAMAERWATDAVALVTAALDRGEVVLERDGMQARTAARFGLVALDESLPGEPRPPAALLDRLAFHIDLDATTVAELTSPTPNRETGDAARVCLQQLGPTDTDLIRAVCIAAWQLGISSLRAPQLALQVAGVHAAWSGRSAIAEADVVVAARLVLAPRATCMPAEGPPPASDGPAPDDPPSQPNPGDARNAEASTEIEPSNATVDPPLEDLLIAAARAAVPPGLLLPGAASQQRTTAAGRSGRAGVARNATARGRITGSQPATKARAERLNVLSTLRAAVPWQRLRRAALASGSAQSSQRLSPNIRVRRDDFRVNRRKRRDGTTIVFGVDASGSAALHRLAEAKGAVELLLAECYVRRDKVALVAFRGTTAEVRLPPTRSLARAKRSLAGLPGGGGTPLAAGIDAVMAVADGIRRDGDTVMVVLLTDGRANVTRAGKSGRAEAQQQALEAARAMRAAGIAAVLMDTSPQPHPFASQLAAEMAGRYVPLPIAGAMSIAAAVQEERVLSLR